MLFWVVFLSVLFADQVTKVLVRTHFMLNESVPVLGNFFRFTYIENEGAAFGIFAGNKWFLVIISIVIMAGLLFFRSKVHKRPFYFEWGVALILAGSIGNLIDRLMKASVTDFFDFGIWPVFNIADIAVTVGVLLLALFVFKYTED